MGVVPRFFIVATLMMRRGFMMMLGSFLMMFRGMLMMFGGFLSVHNDSLICAARIARRLGAPFA